MSPDQTSFRSGAVSSWDEALFAFFTTYDTVRIDRRDHHQSSRNFQFFASYLRLKRSDLPVYYPVASVGEGQIYFLTLLLFPLFKQGSFTTANQFLGNQ